MINRFELQVSTPGLTYDSVEYKPAHLLNNGTLMTDIIYERNGSTQT